MYLGLILLILLFSLSVAVIYKILDWSIPFKIILLKSFMTVWALAISLGLFALIVINFF